MKTSSLINIYFLLLRANNPNPYQYYTISKSKSKQQKNMVKTLLKLNEDLIIHLSIDHYQLNIVDNYQQSYKISSEEKIIYYEVLSHMKKSYMQDNRVVWHYYVFVVDDKYTWSIFRVKNVRQEPLEVYRGKILSEKYQLKQILGIAEMKKKLLIIFSGFKIVYLNFPQEDQVGKQIMAKEYIPYGSEPSYEHQKFSLDNGYLPNQQQNESLFSHFSKLSEQTSIFFIVYRSIIYKLYSIFTIVYDHENSYLRSGKSTLYNIQYEIINIFTTICPEVYLVQTKENVIIWNITKGQDDKFKYQIIKIKFKATLVQLQRNNSICYIGITQDNLIKIVGLKKQTFAFYEESINTVNIPESMNIQEIYPHSNLMDFYLINNKLQLIVLYKNESKTIIFNQNAKIVSSKLYLNPNYNYILIEKVRGKQNEKIIYGNHLFAFNAESYQHGILYNMARIVSFDCNNDTVEVLLTSPLIGLQKLIFSCKNDQRKNQNKGRIIQKGKSKGRSESIIYDKSFQMSIQSNPKLINDETFFLNKKIQILSEQIKEIQSNKSTKVSKLFQDSIEYISNACVFSNELIILSINEQIHVFDSKYKRKYIYCCNSQIKRIYCLNDVNVLGVQLFQADFNGQSTKRNQIMILILEQEKATKLKNIEVQDEYCYIQLSTVINTADYKLNLFGEKLILCSNDALHKYQLQKIQVLDYKIPIPSSSLSRIAFLPIFYYSKQKNNTDFLLIFKEQITENDQQFDKIQIYFASFNSKYLFKKIQFNNVLINYEKVLLLTNLYRDNHLFAIVNNFQEGDSKNNLAYRHLIVFGERSLSIFNMKFGRIELEWNQNRSYIEKQLYKIEKLPSQILLSANNLSILKPLKIMHTNKKEYYLIYNSRQIYYSLYSLENMQTISYYSLINDDFTIFRNNIGLEQIKDDEYMNVFNKKMVIKDIRYLNDQTIFVLYENSIVILEIGFNKSLVVKQELKFNSNESEDIVKIQQFLQNYDKDSIFLRQFHGRIFILKRQQGGYKLLFHSYMDEDVLLFSKVSNWNKRQRSYALEELNLINNYEQELILKKDGQLLLINMKKEENKIEKNLYL